MFFVCVKGYSNASYGVRVMFTLASLIRRSGDDAAVLWTGKKRTDLPEREHRGLEVIHADGFSPAANDIVVYPETTSGNPMGARRVVRYLLNCPWFLSGEGISYGASDYLVTYSPAFASGLPQLHVINDDRELLSAHRNTRKQDEVCIYFGKTDRKSIEAHSGRFKEIAKRYRRVNIATRKHPDRETLIKWMARSRLFVSLDPVSAVNHEATWLRTPAMVLPPLGVRLPGFIDELEEIAASAQVIDQVYFDYCQMLERQVADVRQFVVDVTDHFQRVEADATYAKSTAERSRSHVDSDRRVFAAMRQGKRIVQVDYPFQLPRSLITALHCSRTANRNLRTYLRKTSKSTWPLKYLVTRVVSFDTMRATEKALKGRIKRVASIGTAIGKVRKYLHGKPGQG